MSWQPIETAPKDGTLIDLWDDDACRRLPDCKWHDGRWRQRYAENGTFFIIYEGEDDLSHWMPRPGSPSLGP
jgi:hypothetical protein